MTLDIEVVSSPLRSAFAVSRGAKTEAITVRATVTDDGRRGRGEGVPYPRYGESPEAVVAQIEAARSLIETEGDRRAVLDAMPAGAARCAVDCALWDLEAKRASRRVWEIAGFPKPRPIETAVTISLDKPSAMAAAAKTAAGALLKLKLGGGGDLDRLAAVHEARPDARLILDANEGLDPQTFREIAAEAADLGAVLIEQPFPAGEGDALLRHASAVAICADESAHTAADIERLVKRYDMVNVKLDKAGGLTAALDMVQAARASGMGVMVGCMVAGSLSMAPAVLLAQLADVADLDGPLWLAEDAPDGLAYRDGWVSPPEPALWG